MVSPSTTSRIGRSGQPLLPNSRVQSKCPIWRVHQIGLHTQPSSLFPIWGGGGGWLIATGDDRTGQAWPCVIGGRELKGQDAWIHPTRLSSPPWIYHPLLIRGSRCCLMWTSPSCVLAGREGTACHVQAKGSQMLELSSCPQEFAS